MKPQEDFLIILRGIIKRPVESLLLILGIALGIGATSSGLSIVFSSRAEVAEMLEQTRYREVVVQARESSSEMDLPASLVQTEERIVLTMNDLDAAQAVPDLEYAFVADNTRLFLGERRWGGPSPVNNQNTRTNGNNNQTENSGNENGNMPGYPPDEPGLSGPEPVLEEISGYEVSPAYFLANKLHAKEGSLFTESDLRKGDPMLVLGFELGETLFEDGIALGRQVLSRRQIYTIIGILEPTGTTLDKSCFTMAAYPGTANLDPRLRFGRWNTDLHFTVTNVSRLEEARAGIISWFEKLYGPGSVAVSIPREEVDAMADRNNRLLTIIMILALSALLIAGVNVSNILYSRGIRKRKAVGILKALGATRKGIFQVFFMEALIIGLGGAVAGSILGVFLAGLIRSSLGIKGYSVVVFLLGVILSWATTTFLTNIPAAQISRIPASEAIRNQ